jgi:error-prone DNA polymerase
MQGMMERGYEEQFALQVIEQINGFGEYGFPESHAASFALLVYVSSWLKCHEPAAFCCGLLNSQPMGFYSSSQLIQDVKRHQVEVRAIDVQLSEWDHTLTPKTPPLQPAIRLGLRSVKGLSKHGGERLLQARNQAPFKHINDLVHRAHLNKNDIDALARADALRGLSGHRYQARWQVQGIEEARPLFGMEDNSQSKVVLPSPGEGQDILEDYASTGLSLRRHPLAVLRSSNPQLRCCKTASQLQELSQGRFVQIAGIVTGRQRPGSAAGVIFVTLEDETGNSNIIVWKSVVERQRSVLLRSRLLHIKGTIERERHVVHVIAGQLTDLTHLLGELDTSSRDFH